MTDDDQTGETVIVTREVKPIKHRRLVSRVLNWLVPINERKKKEEERRLTA